MSEELRILVVEDNPADADFIRETLPETGPVTFHIETVARLAEACTRLESQGTDLVLLDLGLPDSQGLQTFHKLRQAAPDIPVIVLTGTDDQEQAVAAVRDGAQDYLVKGQVKGSLLARAARYALERQKAAAVLAALSARQEALLAAVPDIIMEVDDHKIYTWANEAGLTFFGDGVIGKEVAFYFAGEQATYQTLQPLFDGHQDVIRVESWQRRKDGEKRLLAWSCRVLRDERDHVTGALSSARDITEQIRAQQEIESLARFPAENPNPVLRVKLDGQILYANKACMLLPARWNLRAGMPVPATLQAIVAGICKTQQTQTVDVLGEGRVLSISAALVPGVEYVNLYATDITERKRAEEALRAKNEELQRFNRASVGRELRMVELKQQINELCQQLGQPPRHPLEFLDARPQTPTVPETVGPEGASRTEAKSSEERSFKASQTGDSGGVPQRAAE